MSASAILVIIAMSAGVLGTVAVATALGIERLLEDMRLVEPTVTVAGTNVLAIYRRQLYWHRFVFIVALVGFLCCALFIAGAAS